MSAPADTSTVEVARNLYDALLGARPIVKRRLDVVREHGSDLLYSQTAHLLDAIDGALTEAADHLQGDGR